MRPPDEGGQAVLRRVTRLQQRAAAKPPSSTVATLLALLVLIAVLSFLEGGYIFQRTAPVVFAVTVLAIAWLWLARGNVRPSRPYLVALVAFAAFVAWTGLSILWSTGPDLSWLAFDVALLYLLVMAVTGVLPGGPLQLRIAAHGFALVVLAVAAYALLGKIAPDVVTDANLVARISAPIGYWNVLAAMIVMALPILLVSAARRQAAWWVRGPASSGLALLLFTLFFTFSRGGYVALAAALLVYFVLSTTRLSSFVSLIIPAALTGAVLFHLRGLGTLFSATTDDALRTAQGHALARWSLVALALAFAAQALVAAVQRRWSPSARQARTAGVVILAALVLAPIAFGAYYFPRHGGVADWVSTRYHAALSSSGYANDAARLTSLGSSGRIPWFRDALASFVHHPVTGTGAGTFVFTNDLYRTKPQVVKHSHSQWLNVLSELGIVGFALFVVAVGGLLVATFGRLFTDRTDPQRSLLAACQAAMVVFVVHMSIDWDWDMAAITVAFLLLAGASAAYVRDRRRNDRAAGEPTTPLIGDPRRRVLLRSVVTVFLIFGLASWALPYFSQRASDTAIDQVSRGQSAAAAASAKRAADLDPLAVTPLLTLATAQARQGHPEAAAQTLLQAVRLQPGNYEPYYRMGTLVLYVYRDPEAARAWLEAALRLNPLDPASNRLVDSL